jgi:hypothetical protein
MYDFVSRGRSDEIEIWLAMFKKGTGTGSCEIDDGERLI